MNQVGRYRILEELGRGAAGIVYKALDPAIGRTVAIKTIDLGELTNSEERQRVRERLLREAQSAGLLSHPNIVTIYDVLEKEDYAYIFMEYVAGASLEGMLHKGTLPDSDALLQFLRQVADALDYAHRKGIVHRDIKPANIMISEATPHGERLAKIADFGVAKFVSHEMTHSGTMIGTPNYMSPEQIQGLTVDGRSDQFSLAVIVYELLTGVKPFSGENLPALFYQICKQNPKPVEEANPTLGPTVGKVLNRALSKDAADRFNSCVAFIGALSIVLGDSPNWVYVPRPAAAPIGSLDETSAGVEAIPVASVPPRPAAAKSNEITRVRNPEPPVEPPPLPAYELPPLPKRRRPGEDYDADTPQPVERDSFGKKMAVILAMCFAIFAAIVFIVRWNSGPAVPVQVLDTKSGPATPPPDLPDAPQSPTTPLSPATTNRAATARERTTPPVRPARSVAKPQSAPPVSSPPARSSPSDVELLTEPAGAHVTIDGSLSCTSPCTLSLPTGRHTLSVQSDGYEIARRILNVPGDTSLYIPMVRNTGALLVTSIPSGAAVYVDGQEAGHTPVTLHLGTGTHRLVWMLGGDQHQETVEVQSGIQARGFRF